MNAREELRAYIQQLQRRLRLGATSRGAALCAATALVATLVLVAIANHYAFSAGSVTGARWALIAALAAAVAWGLAWPLRRLSRRRGMAHAVARAERQFPGLNQRLTTFTERDAHAPEDPFQELLAADTMELAAQAPPEDLAPRNSVYGALGTAVACAAVLIWIIAAGPGYWGYGAALLWTGPRTHAQPMYSLTVAPGNALIRRHSDATVTALPQGMTAPEVEIHARYQSAAGWQTAVMHPAPGAHGYQYLFAGLPEDVDYYVVAGALRSPTYHLRVRDLPAVKQIQATYQYPAWTGMKAVTDVKAGDLRAVAGTRATLTITTDQPLSGGVLVVDDGAGNPQQVQLAPLGGNQYRGVIDMEKDGLYHVAAQIPGEDPSQPTRISEDYFLAAPPPAPPQVALVRPSGDYRASPIEEVTVSAQASDQFGLKDFALHYSINGGPDKTVELLPQPGAKKADGQTVISFESFHAQPGDLVSVYASAADGDTARGPARSDMMFIQADPFERDFTQSQQAGGGGGGGGGGGQGNTAAQIVDREKEIIAGTFKQQGGNSGQSNETAAAKAKLASDTSKLLSESQTTLHDQAVSLSGRIQSRELTDENQAFSDFQKDMDAAAAAMSPAASSLKGEKWSAAIPNEEKALRSLLQAEATFLKIQIAFGASGGGGGGGGSAARDLASLFDLELDTQKNQYETQQTASASEQKSESINDTLKKLDDLEQRQQQLAQNRNNPAQSAQQRWQQDMLRREAEQLQQQLQSMLNQQNSQSGQSGQSGQSSSSSASSSSSGSPSGSQSASGRSGSSSAASASGAASAEQQAAQAALNRLREANAAMQRSEQQNQSPAQAAADAAQAAAALRQARQALAAMQGQNADQRLAAMAGEAGQLAQTQKQQADQIRKYAAGTQQATPAQVDSLVQQRQQVSNAYDQLEAAMRNAARDLNGAQPGASSKLRNAITAADGSDLGTRLQRSADWLRNGDASPDSETTLSSDLQALANGLRQAQQALTPSAANQSNAALAGAMSQIERLRQQIAALGGTPGQPGNQGNQGNRSGPAGQQFQPGGLSRNGQGQAGNQAGNQAGQQRGQGQQSAQNGQSGGGRSGSQGGGRNGGQGGTNTANGNQQGNPNAGPVGNRIAGANGNLGRNGGILDGRIGDVAGGGNRNGGNYGGYDTGNTRIEGQAVAPQAGPNPADAQREIQQDMEALNRLRPDLPKDPAVQKQIDAFIKQMQALDPSRFPGNPQAVEQARQELLATADALELQVRKKLDDTGNAGQIRDTVPEPAPAGYQDAVAAYYRRLSGDNK